MFRSQVISLSSVRVKRSPRVSSLRYPRIDDVCKLSYPKKLISLPSKWGNIGSAGRRVSTVICQDQFELVVYIAEKRSPEIDI